MLCIVDNMGHGLNTEDSSSLDSLEQFKQAQKDNVAKLERAFSVALDALRTPRFVKGVQAPVCHTLIRARYIATVDATDTVSGIVL
jgi:hypothetical protein